MKTRARWMLALTLVGTVALLAWAFAPRPPQVETETVTSGRFEQSVEEEGRTRLQEVHRISAPVAARLLRIDLREGDRVQAGQALATLRPVLPPLLDARSLAQARAEFRAAQAATDAARARLARAQVSLALAQSQATRSEPLADQGFLSPVRVEADRLAVQAARRDVQAAESEHALALQEQARASVSVMPGPSGVAGSDLVLRAPASGVVLRIASRSEAALAPGALVMEIGEPRPIEVVVPLLTADAMAVRAGSPAVIERWGGPPVPARVRRVEPAAFTRVSALGIEEQRVNVLLDVHQAPAPWQDVGDAFRVHVRIVTESAQDAVLVPVGALFARPDGTLAVYRLEGARARAQVVRLGGRDNRVAWVREGLTAGQRVIVYPPPQVADGVRVRERAP